MLTLPDIDEQEVATCYGKEPFDSFSLAEKVASRRRKRGKPSQVYRCRFCGRFHIGQTMKTKS